MTYVPWTAGQDTTAGGLNAMVGVWTLYTPTWGSSGTAPVLGNGSLYGRYMLEGNKCTVIFEQVMGSTTTFGSGTYFWSTPFTAANPVGSPGTFSYLGAARGHGAAWYTGTSEVLGGLSRIRIYSHNAATEWSPTEPTTWTASNTRYLSAQVAFEIP